MTRTLATLALTLALILSACGGDSSNDNEASDSADEAADVSEEAVADSGTSQPDSTEPPPESDDEGSAAAGAFAVDLDGSRQTGVQVADYGELNVHQVETDDSTVWVTAGDAANEGGAYVALYDLAGSEIGRVDVDGRPLGIAADPDGRGVWYNDGFNGNVDFIDGTAIAVGASIDDATSSLNTVVLNDAGSIWSMRSRDDLVRIDTEAGVVAEEILVPFESSQGNLIMADGTLWGSDILSDTVTAVDLETGEADVFQVVSADAMVLLDTGAVLVAGEQLVTIDPTSGAVTELGSVIYPDKNELFPARFTALAATSHGLYGFDGVHGRLVRIDIEALTAEVIDEVPIGFVGVGDIAESSDGNLWLVVTGEETETDTTDHLRVYELSL